MGKLRGQVAGVTPRPYRERRAAFVLPGGIDTPTGGFRYDRHMIRGLRRAGWTLDVRELPPEFPAPSHSACMSARRAFESLPPGTTTVVDGLAFGVLPSLAIEMRSRLLFIALVHHPLALESGTTVERREALFESERRALACAARVIVPSGATARSLDAYGVAAERVRIVRPGQEPAPLATGSGDRRPRLICVASLTRRKGHDVLLDALVRLRDLDWSLVCVGSDRLAPDNVTRLKDQVSRLALDDRVTFTGPVDETELEKWYTQADLFVLATRYEGYGLVFDEAIAHGLPIIASGEGAVVETLPDEGATMVPVDDPAALAIAIRRFLSDPDHRTRLTDGARRARASRRDWATAVREFSNILSEPAS